jgi:3-methyladenine DNA glycosylase/8-oxoguanine DNA glycosylase
MDASTFFVAQRPQPSVVNHLPVAGPFNQEGTVRLLQRRPANRIDRWEDGQYLRAFQTAEGPRLVTLMNAGTVDVPDVRLEILGGSVSSETARDVTKTVRWMLGCDADPAPTVWLAEMEPRFGAVATALHGFRPPCFPTLFETCASVLPFQQFSLDAGMAIVGRLVEQFGPSRILADRAWFAFPSPEAVAEAPVAALRDVGLSQAKAVALQALARHALVADLNAAHYQSLPTSVALKELEALPGIGPWSAGLILLRGLRRMEIFPAGDVGAARNLPALLGLAASWSPADASAFADRFADRRGYLYFLGLGAQLLARGVIEPADQH